LEVIKETDCCGKRIQLDKSSRIKIYIDAEMGSKEVKAFCRIDREGEKLLALNLKKNI